MLMKAVSKIKTGPVKTGGGGDGAGGRGSGEVVEEAVEAQLVVVVVAKMLVAFVHCQAISQSSKIIEILF